MYTIYVDGSLLYSPNLADEGYAVLDPKVRLTLNSANSFECKVPISNPRYSHIAKLKSVVKVYDGTTRIFRGRVIDDKRDFYNHTKLTVQGELAYLNDSILRPYSYSGSVSGYFSMLVDQHNAQVDAVKQFRVGNITVIDANDYIVRENSEAVATWKEMKSKLLDLLGGYIMPRYEVENGQEVEYLDYLADSGGQNGQPIIFAENLLDLEQFIDASEVCTVLVPYGKADGETNARLDIKSANNGCDYIESAAGISLFGRVVGTEVWDDVTIADNLLAKATALLADKILMAVQLKLKAVDLSRIGANTSMIRIGEYNRVVSPPHGIDAWYQCSGITLRLDKIAGSEFSFGATGTTLTQYQAASAASSESAAISARNASAAANATANALNIAISEMGEEYSTRAQYNALSVRVAALEAHKYAYGTVTTSEAVLAGSYADITVTFDAAFATTPCVILQAQTEDTELVVTASSTTGFTARAKNLSAADTTITYTWLALV